jgi:hypothetical protein
MKWGELRRKVKEREQAYYVDVFRRYPWPIADIRAASPVVSPTVGAARLLAGRCRRVTYGWLAEDLGRQLTPDEQGALLRCQSEREPLAFIIQHAGGGLTGWYLRPVISREVRQWLCPAALGLGPAAAPEPEPGDEVIWLLADEKVRK